MNLYIDIEIHPQYTVKEKKIPNTVVFIKHAIQWYMDLLLTTVTSLHENLNVYIVLYYLLFTGFVILFKYNNIQAYIFKQKDNISFQIR